jgi:predicted RNA binding protein YcfA (HicA-like mRNA interferase family)
MPFAFGLTRFDPRHLGEPPNSPWGGWPKSSPRAFCERSDAWGWTVDRQSGSHVVLAKPGRSPVTVPVHRGKTLKEGTARAILKQAGVSEDEFFDVY